MTTTTNTPAASTPSNYINLHTVGIGYISRVRKVEVKKGNAFYAASIRAMFGEKGVKDGVSYTPYDVKAVSEQAEMVLRDFEADMNNDAKRVTVQFKIGDAEINTFTYKTGPKAGEMGIVMKGRLVKIERVWVKDLSQSGSEQEGNVLKYTAPVKESAEDQGEARTGTNG